MESVCCSYICVFWVLVCPCQLFVRLWYRVSDVLDLSLVSKRFGFLPHITHVIVLTFKEIKHLSDYRTVELSDCRTIGPSDYRTDYRSDPDRSIVTNIQLAVLFMEGYNLCLFKIVWKWGIFYCFVYKHCNRFIKLWTSLKPRTKFITFCKRNFLFVSITLIRVGSAPFVKHVAHFTIFSGSQISQTLVKGILYWSDKSS